MGAGMFQGTNVIPTLATLGIVSLFLFAGLEVDFRELARGARVTVGHLVVQFVVLVAGSALLSLLFGLEWRAAVVLALAILTPSTGFILDSLPGFGLTAEQQGWVKTKAIATELLALAALFVAVRSTSAGTLLGSTAAIVVLVAGLPYVFQAFAKRVLPYAPKSEFAFLLILALASAYLTRALGVYYLVGAFVVGVTAVRLRKRIPALSSERLLGGIELFASFFIPFYFFKAGISLRTEDFGWGALLLGFAFVVVAIPLRIGLVVAHRMMALGESPREASRVGISLVPTLVFTLVLAGILRERFGLEPRLFGALIVFALVNTIIPGMILEGARLEFAEHEAPRLPSSARIDRPATDASSGSDDARGRVP
jgi:Kef-type K+ transport system membrane component KefB